MRIHAALLVLCFGLQELAAPGAPLLKSDFESPGQTYNPWGGVDSAGNLRVPGAGQLAVDDNGKIQNCLASPALAVGDLNGDGRPDLVVADTRGFLWFYPNQGTATEPKFSFGEVLPLWFGSEDIRQVPHSHAVVPRIQLVDVDGDGKLDLLVGTYDGRLYYAHNNGTAQQPAFSMLQQLNQMEVKTSTSGQPWCNYLSPYLVDWFKNGVQYLLIGDGTYSANSVYMLKDSGDKSKLEFKDGNKVKIIPGMGREQINPQVVDWNGDGKPDVLCGERTGHVTIFLNNSSSDSPTPTFDAGTLVKLGGRDLFAPFSAPCVADLNGNHLPNLVLSAPDGQISYAKNTGTAGQPAFTEAVSTLKGKNPYPPILTAPNWSLGTPYGDSYNLLVVTNAQVDPNFAPPPGHVGKNALKAFVYPSSNTYFKTRYFVNPNNESDNFSNPNEHFVSCNTGFKMQQGKQYHYSFYVLTDGVSELRAQANGIEWNNLDKSHVDFSITKPFSGGSSWTKISDTFSWNTHYNQKNATEGFSFSIRWHGEGSICIDDVVIDSE